MKLPEKIKGRNRIRDGAIVLYFKRDSMDFNELAEKFNLTERRIQQILAKNNAFIRRDKDWEKEKRINRLQRFIKSKENFGTSKDILDVQAELRKEIEGDDEKSRGPGETKIIIIRAGEQTENTAKQISGRISIQRA